MDITVLENTNRPYPAEQPARQCVECGLTNRDYLFVLRYRFAEVALCKMCLKTTIRQQQEALETHWDEV